jgi:hypothetical protein
MYEALKENKFKELLRELQLSIVTAWQLKFPLQCPDVTV